MARFRIGPGVARAATAQGYTRQPGDPLTRPLRIYTLDPTVATHLGAIATIEVPFEPLEPGPRGALFEVDSRDGGVTYSKVDLNDARVLLHCGVEPSPANHQFHQQMVYAVAASVYGTFRTALGRQVAWAFERPSTDGRTRLRLVPHGAGMGANAAYDRNAGEIRFGYYPAPAAVRGRNLPGGPVYTCLSHDVIVHELTHALVDGLRSHFLDPTGPEVLGFHEGFSDLITVLQHFRYPKMLERQIARHRGLIDQPGCLTAIAEQFGLTTGHTHSLRSAIQSDGPARFSRSATPHEMGTVLVTAVFQALADSYRRRIQRYLALLPAADAPLPDSLVEILAEEATKLAGHFQMMCIRALDYCPPIDLEFGEYLRAVLTADRDLMPSDRYGYRESLIDAFAAAGIYPAGVSAFAEDALVWRAPRRYVPPAPGLCFGDLRFDGDPSFPACQEEMLRQARALGEFITRPENIGEFGLVDARHPLLEGDQVDVPCVQSIRTSRRGGDNGEVLFDLVAEVTQERYVRIPGTDRVTSFVGGATVIIGPRGEVRYVISKNILRKDRLDRQLEYQRESVPDGAAAENPLEPLHLQAVLS